jgi:hypothetical protein
MCWVDLFVIFSNIGCYFTKLHEHVEFRNWEEGFFFTFMWPCIITNFLTIKPTRCTNFSNLFWNETLHVSDNSFVHYQELFTVHSTMVYVIQTAFEQEHMLLLKNCLQTCMTYTIAECTVRTSWWWTEELSETCRVSFQNKFEKLVHLVGFIVRKWEAGCFVSWRKLILNGICMKLVLPKRAMAEPVSYRLAIAEAGVRSRVCVRSVVEKWYSYRFFSEYFGFSLSVSFHRCSILILIVTGLHLLSEGQLSEDWEPSRLFGSSRQESTLTLFF